MKPIAKLVKKLLPGIIEAERADAARNALSIALRENSEFEAGGFRRLSEYGSPRLNPIDQDRLVTIARGLFARNPLARRLVDIVHDFLASVELAFSAATAPAVRDWCRDFWNHPRNALPGLLPKLAARLYLDGEVLLPFDVNPQTGAIALRFRDPLDIAKIEAVPGDPSKIEAVLLKAKADGTQERLRVVRFRETATILIGEPDAGNAKEVDAGGFRTGECFYWRINDLVDGRGRSGLEAVIDWLEIHDRTFYDQLRSVALQDAFLFDVTMKGATPEMVQARRLELAAEGPPKAGSIRVHNELEEWKALAPDINPSITGDLLVQARKVIGLGAGGRSETWIAASEDVNRATAEIADSPPVKNLERLQAEFERHVAEMVEAAIDFGILFGSLPRDLAPEERSFRIVTPDLGAKDSLATAQALAALLPALEIAETRGYIDKATARRLVYATAGEEMPEDLDVIIAAEKRAEEEELIAVPEAVAPRKEENGFMHPPEHYLLVMDPERPRTWGFRYRDARGEILPQLLLACEEELFGPEARGLPLTIRRSVARRLRRLMNEFELIPGEELAQLAGEKW